MTINPPFKNVNEFISLLKKRPTEWNNSQNTNPPLVSIISPFFNDKEYWQEAYQSIANQTWQNFEWIIVDDRSTEAESIHLIRSISQLNPKIKTFQNETNKGPSASRNLAISKAQGKYLFFMDTDDIIDSTYIEKCVLFLEIYPEFSLVNSYSVGFQGEEYWWNFGFDKPNKFIEQNWVTGRLLYRTKDFLELGGYNEEWRVYEDWERWLRALTNGQKAWTIPEHLDCYRRTSSGLLAEGRNNKLENKKIVESIKEQYQDYFKNNTISNPYLDRASFQSTPLRKKLTIKNTLNPDNRGKRILCFFPHLVVGGADKFNLDLVTALTERNYNITIATTLPSDHNWHSQFYPCTQDIFHLSNFLPDCHWLTITRYLIESRNIDLVLISNSYYAYYLLPFLRKEFPYVAFIDYTHTDDPGWRDGGYPRISCQLSDFLDLQVVSSKNLANYYQKIKPEVKNKLRVCYTNEDTEKWQPNLIKRKELREQLAIKEDRVMLLFPARIAAQKRPLFLVDIIHKLVQKSQSVIVIMLGSGDLLEPVKEKIKQLELESYFQIIPSVLPEEMINYYSAADIFLLPSEYEGLSLAIYEAMAMELPIVASDVGGNRELVIPGCGCLLPKGNADEEETEQYVDILEPLVTDINLRKQLGKTARKRIIKYFPLSGMIDKMEKIFSEAIEIRKNRNPSSFNSAIAEEMLIWLQEHIALEHIWYELQNRNQELANMNAFMEKLQIENNQLKSQNKAWIKIAQKAQTELAKVQQKK